jgi:hypothetical protein
VGRGFTWLGKLGGTHDRVQTPMGADQLRHQVSKPRQLLVQVRPVQQSYLHNSFGEAIVKEVKIEEVVTFIKATREEAITLAYELGGGEVHALHLMRGFAPAPAPVGYLVLPHKEENK